MFRPCAPLGPIIERWTNSQLFLAEVLNLAYTPTLPNSNLNPNPNPTLTLTLTPIPINPNPNAQPYNPNPNPNSDPNPDHRCRPARRRCCR